MPKKSQINEYSDLIRISHFEGDFEWTKLEHHLILHKAGGKLVPFDEFKLEISHIL